MKKKAFDPPRSPSLFPQPKLDEKSDAQTIVSTIPSEIERAREAFGRIESRCARAVEKGADEKLRGIAREIRALLPALEEWRKQVDGIIHESKSDDLF